MPPASRDWLLEIEVTSRPANRRADEAAGFGLVSDVPAEVDLCVGQLATADRQDLRVAGSPARTRDFIVHEDSVAVFDHMDEFESADRVAVSPAAFEVDLPIEPIVEWAREVEVLGDQFFERVAVLVDVC